MIPKYYGAVGISTVSVKLRVENLIAIFYFGIYKPTSKI